MLSGIFMMATRIGTDRAIKICTLTSFSAVPKSDLMCRCCLNHLKNRTTCQR